MRVPSDDGDTPPPSAASPPASSAPSPRPTCPAGWALTGIEPNPVTVTDNDSDVDATITNTRVLGGLTVTKRLVRRRRRRRHHLHDARGLPGRGIDQDVTLTVTDGESASETIDGIPTGVACIVTETAIPEGGDLASSGPSRSRSVKATRWS